MARGVHAAVRFAIGVTFTALVLKFVGITWNDVHYFITNGLKSAFEIFEMFHNVAR